MRTTRSVGTSWWPRLLGALMATGVCGMAAVESMAQPSDVEWDDRYYPYGREGVYVGVGATYVMENFDREPAIEDPQSPLRIDADDTGGAIVRLGYRLHQRVAAEVQFQYYSDFEISIEDSDESDSFGGWSFTLNGKAYGLLGRVQPYGLVGLGGVAFEDKRGSDSAFLARLGGGVDLYLSDHLVLDLEVAYGLPAEPLDDFQFVTFGIGVQYRY